MNTIYNSITNIDPKIKEYIHIFLIDHLFEINSRSKMSGHVLFDIDDVPLDTIIKKQIDYVFGKNDVSLFDIGAVIWMKWDRNKGFVYKDEKSLSDILTIEEMTKYLSLNL